MAGVLVNPIRPPKETFRAELAASGWGGNRAVFVHGRHARLANLSDDIASLGLGSLGAVCNWRLPTTATGRTMRLEDLQPRCAVRGVHPDGLVTVVSVQWFGSEAVELTYKTQAGAVANELLYRHDETRLEVVAQGRPWSFDGDGALFRLVSEAQRIRLAHLFDPLLAIHTSVVDPLPHQITGVYDAMLPRQPLRFLLADDPGAGKTIMAGLLIKELVAPRRPGAVPDRLPRQPRRAVAGRAVPPIPASFRNPDQ